MMGGGKVGNKGAEGTACKKSERGRAEPHAASGAGMQRATAVNQWFTESLCTHCPPLLVHFLHQGSFPACLLWAGSCRYW